MKKIFTIFVYIFAAIGFILVAGYIALFFGFTKTRGVIDTQHDYFKNKMVEESWKDTEEWLTLSTAIKKDTQVIQKVSQETGISTRIIISPLVVEQLRLFYSQREIFKQVFAPLKILGNQSQFSWGVMGIKQNTAQQIESHLKDRSSPWYLGEKYEHVLDFTTNDPDTERFGRLTDPYNRYYSYLYAALYIKQVQQQWRNAGFPIDNNAGIIATLYNIGFLNSKPHINPQKGGASLEINKTTYSFGGLAQSFYDSSELSDSFQK